MVGFEKDGTNFLFPNIGCLFLSPKVTITIAKQVNNKIKGKELR